MSAAQTRDPEWAEELLRFDPGGQKSLLRRAVETLLEEYDRRGAELAALRRQAAPLHVLRTPADVGQVCTAAGLEQDTTNGNWLAPDRSFGVGVARVGAALLGAEVVLPPPYVGAKQRGLVRVFPDAPASLLAHAIAVARAAAAGGEPW